MSIDITYNGNKIAALEGGKTAVIKCAGKKMKSDLTVIAPEGGGGGGTSGVTGLRAFNSTITTDGLTPIPFASQEEMQAYVSNPPNPIKCNFVNWGGLGYIYVKCDLIPFYASMGGQTQFMVLVKEDGKPGQTGFGDIIDNAMLSTYIIDIADSGQYEQWLLANTVENTIPQAWAVPVGSEAEMDELKETAHIASIYRYMGETTDTYQKEAHYILRESDNNGTITRYFSKMSW